MLYIYSNHNNTKSILTFFDISNTFESSYICLNTNKIILFSFCSIPKCGYHSILTQYTYDADIKRIILKNTEMTLLSVFSEQQTKGSMASLNYLGSLFYFHDESKVISERTADKEGEF